MPDIVWILLVVLAFIVGGIWLFRRKRIPTNYGSGSSGNRSNDKPYNKDKY